MSWFSRSTNTAEHLLGIKLIRLSIGDWGTLSHFSRRAIFSCWRVDGRASIDAVLGDDRHEIERRTDCCSPKESMRPVDLICIPHDPQANMPTLKSYTYSYYIGNFYAQNDVYCGFHVPARSTATIVCVHTKVRLIGGCHRTALGRPQLVIFLSSVFTASRMLCYQWDSS